MKYDYQCEIFGRCVDPDIMKAHMENSALVGGKTMWFFRLV